jgi:hypothetical protein
MFYSTVRSASLLLYINIKPFYLDSEYSGTVNQLLIDFRKTYDSVIEFGIPKKIVRIIKMCLNETYSKIRIGKHLSGEFPVKNDLKQGDALSPLLFNFALEYAMMKVKKRKKKRERDWN